MADNLPRAVISVIGSRVGAMLIGVVTTPLLVRLLGSSQYGVYATAMAIFGILLVFTESGVFDGSRKYIAENREVDGWESYVFGFYFRWSIAVSAAIAIVLLGVGLAGLGTILFPKNLMTYMTLITILLASNQISAVLRGALIGLRFEPISESLQVLNRLIFAISALTLVYYGFGAAGAVAGNIIGAVIVSAISIWFVRGHLSLSKIFERTSNAIPSSDLISYNYMTTVLALFTVSLYHIDVLLLQTFVGSTQTGHYKAALNLAQFLWVVPIAVQIVLVQSISEKWSEGEDEEISNIATVATRYTLALSVLITIGLAVLADIFVPIYYGSDFEAATIPLVLLLPGVVGFAVARPIVAIGKGIGSLGKLVVATGVAAILNLCLNLILIPRYGLYGAAVSTSIGYASMLVFHTITAFRIGYNPIADIRICRIGAAALILFVTLVVGRLAIPSNFLVLITLPPLGAVIYTVVSIILGVVTSQEIKSLIEGTPLDNTILVWLLDLFPELGDIN
jgi:O-antigen/teichoic acid export membrane protein